MSDARRRRICVFCGSSDGVRPQYRTAAEQLADVLAARDIGVVFGGGRLGLMGVLADRMLAHGGEVVAVIPSYLRKAEVEHLGVTVQHVVSDLFERKAMMLMLADQFVALPGGMGTLDELLEVLTWRQLGQLPKPVGILNVAGYFDGFMALLRHFVAEGFLADNHLRAPVVETDAARLVDTLTAGQEPEPSP